MTTNKLDVKKVRGEYEQCCFCSSNKFLFKIRGKGRQLVITICGFCIDEIDKKTK